MRNKIKSLFGLRWNPFLPDVPVECLYCSSAQENFLWRVEQLVIDGGFALISGDAGTGKSVTLRQLSTRLSKIPELAVIEITKPTSSLLDFYRELCAAFNITMSSTNRFLGYKKLRDKWLNHLDTTLFRPVIIIDEAQDVHHQVLTELRLLSSSDFDSKIIAAVILAGDNRLLERFKTPELIPLGSRIRLRLRMESRLSVTELHKILDLLLEKAGAPDLMTQGVKDILIDSCMGNMRQLMVFCNELLEEAAASNSLKLDEPLFYKCFQPECNKTSRKQGKKI